MRPLRVVMQAFGPYAGRQELDFADLGESRFFLIAGPTGAGKTTVLDAMAFALYGDSSGAERDARDMRSQHAPADLPTEVEFDFSVGGAVYRILRIPQQERPKKRGEGTVVAAQQATIWPLRREPDALVPGAPLATGWSAVSAQANAILGFRSEQFRQVVMLPQGRFQDLLRADSRAKEEILAALFDTSFYGRIERALRERAAALGKAFERLAIERETVLRQTGAADDDALAARRTEAAAAAKRAAAESAARNAASAAAETALSEARAVVERLDELAAADAALTEVERGGGAAGALRDEAAAARRAAALAGEAAARDQRRAELAASERELAEAAAALDDALEQARRSGEELHAEQARAPEREAAADEVARLRALAPRVAQLQTARDELVAARRLRDQAVKAASAAAANVADAEAALTAARADLQARRDAAAGAEQLAEAARRAAETAARRRALDAVAARARDAEADARRHQERTEQADAAYDEAVANLRAVESQWQAGQAARLAATLEPDRPCPVCGSTDHPAPALPPTKLPPSDDDLEAARSDLAVRFAERDEARATYAAARHRAGLLDAEARQLGAALGDAAGLAVADCEAHAREAQQAAETAAAAAASLPHAVRAEADAAAVLERARSERLRADTAASERASAVVALEATLAERAEGIPVELADAPAVEAALAAAERRRDELAASLKAAEAQARDADLAAEAAKARSAAAGSQVQAAHASLAAAEARLSERLAAHGFADEAEWVRATRDEERVTELDAAVKRYDDALVAARERRRAAASAARGLQRPDIESLEGAAADARRLADGAAASRADADAERRRLDDAARQLAEVAAAAGEVQKDYEVVGRVADTVQGTNAYRLGLQRFVLGVYLDGVLEVASARLRDMTSGRFELERTELSRGHGRAAGLELVVSDAWTGETRPVSTLSGGETFLAALALALGLAEVVQHYSGGIRLDTVFVDEGFGSLDAEALDLAITTLMSLQQGGRLVGIISHLAEVRERIDARLEISAGKRGSTARFVVP